MPSANNPKQHIPTVDDMYLPGTYCISLTPMCLWYIKKATQKGVMPTRTHVHDVIPEVVKHVLGQEYDRDAVALAMNLDCRIGNEAEQVFQDLTRMVTAEVMNHFPKLGAQLPEHYFHQQGKDLYINVPDTFKDQIGYFF